MLIEPLVSLAFTLYSNKGAYALLLGSGISRSAGIPTGWEIVQDLIRKLAAVKGEECAPTPEEWFAINYDQQPDYSDLLGQLAKTSTERSRLLRAYFEPDDKERESGVKTPTPAHRAIAELMAKGYVRVVLTTNFDRLLETALADRGIAPSVVSTADSVEGMLPLPHAQNLIVKVNGDYLDARIKNTRAELEHYDERLLRLLDRIFDEFGLVVCGWSADWDVALRGCIERCQSRRFAAYWTAKGELTAKAADLIALRRAELVPITEADSFFSSVSEKVLAFEDIETAHPASARVAVARAKRYLARSERTIDLNDLVVAATERVCASLGHRSFDLNVGWSEGEFQRRVRSFEGAATVLLHLFACGGRWGEQRHRPIWHQSLARIANLALTPRSGISVWPAMRVYPATLLLYAYGVAAIAADHYADLIQLLEMPLKDWRSGDERGSVHFLNASRALNQDATKTLPGLKGRNTPVSDHLFGVIREPVRDYLTDDPSYTECFDYFEYLAALAYWNLNPGWAPLGCFAWRSGAPLIMSGRNQNGQGDTALPRRLKAALDGGLCDGSAERLTTVRHDFNEWARNVAWRWL